MEIWVIRNESKCWVCKRNQKENENTIIKDGKYSIMCNSHVVWMCVYVWVCVFVCMYVCAYMCVCMYVCLCVCLTIHDCVYSSVEMEKSALSQQKAPLIPITHAPDEKIFFRFWFFYTDFNSWFTFRYWIMS